MDSCPWETVLCYSVELPFLVGGVPSLLHFSSSRMPATRLCPVIELTPLPPAVRALYSPPPAQSRHRTVSNTSTRSHSPLITCQFCEKCRRPSAFRILASLHTRPTKRKRPSPEDDDDDLWSDSELVHILQGWVTVRLLNAPDAQMLSTMSTVQTVCRRLPLWLSVVQSEKDGSRVAPRARPGCTWKG